MLQELTIRATRVCHNVSGPPVINSLELWGTDNPLLWGLEVSTSMHARGHALCRQYCPEHS